MTCACVYVHACGNDAFARARARARSGAFEASFLRASTNCLFVETLAQRRALDVKRLERETHVITSVIT